MENFFGSELLFLGGGGWSCVFWWVFAYVFVFFWRFAPESDPKNSLDVRSVVFWGSFTNPLVFLVDAVIAFF